MSIWRNQTLVHITISKPFITLKEENFITELIIKLPEPSSYLSDNTTFQDDPDEEGYQNLKNAIER